MTQTDSNLRVIGNIAGFHGVRGEIKIFPLVDDINNFKKIKEIYLEENPKQGLKKFTIEKTRPHKKFVLIKLKDYNDLNSVEHLSGHIQASIDEDLDDDEFYIEDLKGLNVTNEKDETVGKVTNIEDEGQTRIHIHLDSKFNAKRELIVPFVKEYILEVSIKEQKIKVNLTDDILELAL